MPTENRVECKQRFEFLKSLMVDNLSFHREPFPRIVVEQDVFLTELLFQYSIRGALVLDRFLLLTIQPSHQDEGVELPGLPDKFHREISLALPLHPVPLVEGPQLVTPHLIHDLRRFLWRERHQPDIDAGHLETRSITAISMTHLSLFLQDGYRLSIGWAKF